MKYCSKCGNELMDEAVICPKCGCPVDTPVVPKKKKRGVKIALIVVGILVVLSIVGTIFGGESGTAISPQEEAAYACAQDLVERIMKLATNPYSMKVHTLKYAFKEEDEAYCAIYIEYTLLDGAGRGNEEDGVCNYTVDMENCTYDMIPTDAIKFTSAALFGGFSLPHDSIYIYSDVSEWTNLDVNVVKQATGLE